MRLRKLVVGSAIVVGLAGCGTPSLAMQGASPSPAQAGGETRVEGIVSSPNAALASVEPSSAASAPPSAPASPAPASVPAPPAALTVASPAPPAPVGPPVTTTPASFRLKPLQYIRQTLNNCGPASIAEVLHYWGVERSQAQTQAVLRPDGNSRGMMPYPVPAYLHGLGMNAVMGVGGTPTIVKALVTNGFPVIVAQSVSLQEPIAHYREIEGFDDQRKTFVSTDSYLGPNHEIGYDEFDQLWARGNQRFMVIYPPAKEALVNAVMQSVGWDKTAAYQKDLERQERGEVFPQPGVYRPSFPGSAELNRAWIYIQLGQLDGARAAIQQVPVSPRSAQMIGWLNGAMAVAAA